MKREPNGPRSTTNGGGPIASRACVLYEAGHSEDKQDQDKEDEERPVGSNNAAA